MNGGEKNLSMSVKRLDFGTTESRSSTTLNALKCIYGHVEHDIKKWFASHPSKNNGYSPENN